MTRQLAIFQKTQEDGRKRVYLPLLSASKNRKGVLDVDTVKGCAAGMGFYPVGGCYGECYAYKNAVRYGFDFSVSVSRMPTPRAFRNVFFIVRNNNASWYRIGTAGDPCHDWENTLTVCEMLRSTGKIPVIVTKHWTILSDEDIGRLKTVSAVVNTSTSGLDSYAEIEYRVGQFSRLEDHGVKSICRVVTCDYGRSEWGRENQDKQDYLLSLKPLIENPLRVSRSNEHLTNGDLKVKNISMAVGGGKLISSREDSAYLGSCNECPDQCGVEPSQDEKKESTGAHLVQSSIFDEGGIDDFLGVHKWVFVESVIGSGYEADVSRLAIADGIAKRAARKNMQMHSAIIFKVDGEVCGFFTFQVNHVSKEFCLLQSVIEPSQFTKDLYAKMVLEVIGRNVCGYPALITTDPKSKFETPKLFEELGFQTYLKMSGFHYMVKGDLADVRMKLLAHITMTNVWNSVKGDWLRLKKEWRARIEEAGSVNGVENPAFATREGCWQGTQGMANVVTKDPTKKGKEEGRAHNGNASVLDPVACEVIARFFMPVDGKRVYNPFGGGVQFGYISGDCGYEYIASEIRQNQCDANNKLCTEFGAVKWIQSDSATFEPPGMFDLVFTCPPYYKVERYLDYNNEVPEGEINACGSYEEFRSLLFAGYRIAIEHLHENRFFVVMVGDSRDKDGSYFCVEAETEMFFKDHGLCVYNKIVYLESEFTRLAHAKKTLHVRKFPKREQKIIVAYKGKAKDIKEHFAPIGRL